MNECPECGGLIIEDVEDDDYTDRVYGYYCPGCGWSSDDINDEEKPGEDYNEHPDFEVCPSCGGVGSEHSAMCLEDDALWY